MAGRGLWGGYGWGWFFVSRKGGANSNALYIPYVNTRMLMKRSFKYEVIRVRAEVTGVSQDDVLIKDVVG